VSLNFIIFILTNTIKHKKIYTNLNNFYLKVYRLKKYLMFGKSGFLKEKKMNGNKIKGIVRDSMDSS
jgi:hypothetical protein